MTRQNPQNATQLGILLMIGAAVTFGVQDGLSRLLAEGHGPITVIAIRYWFFALFVLGFAATRAGGIRRVARSNRPWLQTALQASTPLPPPRPAARMARAPGSAKRHLRAT